ncbi:MAG: glycerol-3-phosphate 1-O-acyltransferase [Gammaproteobacteria bacterium]|nr:glycerol-3-phosphate 1-O-acyltransferase [Gammaproteobacteria bacterium]
MTTKGEPGPWPDPPVESVLFVLDADNKVEQESLQRWLDSTRAESAANDTETAQVVLPILNGKKGRLEIGQLPEKLEMDGNTRVVPLRVVWLPEKSARQSTPRLRDLFLGDPRHPGRLAAQMIMRSNPDRARCVAGASATIDELRERFSELLISDGADDFETDDDFAAFVVRRAGLALDVAERRLQGNRYKVPHYVADGLRANKKFNRAMDKLALELGKPVSELHEEARRYMKEMVAEPSSFFIDWMGKVTRFIVSLGYGNEIVCNAEDLERTRQILRDYPSALLWTHKSHVDGMAVLSMLYENDLPAPHSLGGINMAFAGLGMLGRKSGVIYIRRTFQDNPVYKLVFRHYLGYLMDKRFPFSWAFEGTRSRIGKLMPPRYGLIKYVVEAAHATRARDLHFIPVSISYDLIGEVADYALEQSGAQKRPESLRWFLGYVAKMRAPKGRIYFDFGEPVVIAGATPPPEEVDMSKTAFEIAVRVNNMTPVTFPSLAAIVLLGWAPRAITLEEFRAEVLEFVVWLRKRNIRLTDNFDKGHDKQLAELARLTIDRGLVSMYDEGSEPVYGISEDQYAVAGYYRNTIVHYFVNKAILELALVKASGTRTADRVDTFWEETDRLRDLFKFEFFYSPKDEFREQLADEMSMYDENWEAVLGGEAGGVLDMLANMRPLLAHATLLPYIESYGVVAEVLERLEPGVGIDEKECVSLSLKYGEQRYRQRRISSKASIAKLLFSNGYNLFSNLGLTAGGDPALAEQREIVSAEFVELSDRLERIHKLAQLPRTKRRAKAHARSNGE